jgi:glycosyltransferase involved in cell wall biosynthesis
VFLFPSIYEGFGWPPLEAMACGCPVVCSSSASLPEVVGDAALTAAVDDEAGLARLCGMVLSDRVLAESLIARGKQRASEFTLERMGKQLVDVYRRVLERTPQELARERQPIR